MAENQTPLSPGDFAGAEVDRSNAARSDERENDRARGAVDEGGLGRDLGRIQGNTRDRGVRDLERHGEACATIVVISPRAEPGRARRHIQGNPLGLGAVFAPCLETYVSPAHEAVQFFRSCWRCSKKCCDQSGENEGAETLHAATLARMFPIVDWALHADSTSSDCGDCPVELRRGSRNVAGSSAAVHTSMPAYPASPASAGPQISA